MGESFALLIGVIAVAVIFDYINGFHDTANAIATVVSTNVLHPRTAIILAALFNFIGALTGTSVAKTIGNDITDPTTITQTVVLSALAAAVVWNLITWYFGIPSSSSHALVGGLIGSVLCHHVLDEGKPFKDDLWTLLSSSGSTKVLKGLVLSPICGLIGGFTIMVILFWIVKRVSPVWVNRVFRKLQLVSASLMAHSHGSNDAQKAMGVITMALVAYYKGHPQDAHQLGLNMQPGKGGYEVPIWVIFTCASAMALGTAAGGWRIMHTMGHKIIKLRPIDGFAAETAGAAIIETASRLGVPVSTTHVIASSIMGVGASKRFSAVRWGVAGNIVVAWVLTIPVSAVVAGLMYLLLRLIVGK
jgi:PiT family inorganic phosphate transporter